MGNARFSDDFKRDAVHPLSDSGLLANHERKITVRGYPVAEVSKRLGVSTHALYIWVKRFPKHLMQTAKTTMPQRTGG